MPGFEFSLDSKKLDSTISEFLQNRQLNRLSSPHQVAVFSTATLRKWLDQNKPKYNYNYQNLLGKYAVFFKNSPKEEGLMKEELEIYEANGQIKVKFSFKLSRQRVSKEKKVLEGNGFIDIADKVLSVLLYEQQSTNSQQAKKMESGTTFLLINIPNGTYKLEILTGIATGPREQSIGLVSRLLIFVKLENNKIPARVKEDRILEFLNYFKNSSWIRPPMNRAIPVMHKFSHLEELRKSFFKKFKDTI